MSNKKRVHQRPFLRTQAGLRGKTPYKSRLIKARLMRPWAMSYTRFIFLPTVRAAGQLHNPL